ncbi:hypothetical protein CIPAW_07G074400 [Carya illinoinensis]|nr:hypothetical protein CIPAW_07G074400 [Carya illinoinensis]KAG6703272.1 hypothetical protein I3842_07G075700 [Carya illinoinensis]
MASLRLLTQPLSSPPSFSTPLFPQYPLHIPCLTSLKPSNTKKPLLYKSPTVPLALTESSDSPKSLEPNNPQYLLKQLADSFDLPQDYFVQLPRDLRIDLNDAAFDLSSGPVIDECGQELGEILLNLCRAWELADTSTSYSLARKLPELEMSLTDSAKSALGKRLVRAGMRFQSMGQYSQGELQKIAKVMITTGRLLSANTTAVEEQPKEETKMLKFGDLQVELTPDKANIGAVIGFAFG